MATFEEQFEELMKFYPQAKRTTDVGVEFILLPELDLPSGCVPAVTDAVLSPSNKRDGYHSRLFYPQLITGIPDKNWNGNLRIGEKNWVAYSWHANQEMTLLEMVRYHLKTLMKQ